LKREEKGHQNLLPYEEKGEETTISSLLQGRKRRGKVPGISHFLEGGKSLLLQFF